MNNKLTYVYVICRTIIFGLIGIWGLWCWIDLLVWVAEKHWLLAIAYVIISGILLPLIYYWYVRMRDLAKIKMAGHEEMMKRVKRHEQEFYSSCKEAEDLLRKGKSASSPEAQLLRSQSHTHGELFNKCIESLEKTREAERADAQLKWQKVAAAVACIALIIPNFISTPIPIPILKWFVTDASRTQKEDSLLERIAEGMLSMQINENTQVGEELVIPEHHLMVTIDKATPIGNRTPNGYRMHFRITVKTLLYTVANIEVQTNPRGNIVSMWFNDTTFLCMKHNRECF